MKNTATSLCMLVLMAFAPPCLAHPLPDVAVRAHFEQNGDWMLQVEIDPRSFQPDPNVAPYLTNADLAVTPEDQQEKLKATAREYALRAVEIILDPPAEVKPDLVWEFTAAENAPLKLPEDPVMLTGTWRTRLPDGSTGYSIKSTLPPKTLNMLYHNTALGKKVERYQILFPGETSYVLDLKTFTPRTKAPPPITAESLQTGAVPDSLDGGCELCGTSAGGGYMLPTVISVAGIVVLVTWLRRKRAA